MQKIKTILQYLSFAPLGALSDYPELSYCPLKNITTDKRTGDERAFNIDIEKVVWKKISKTFF